MEYVNGVVLEFKTINDTWNYAEYHRMQSYDTDYRKCLLVSCILFLMCISLPVMIFGGVCYDHRDYSALCPDKSGSVEVVLIGMLVFAGSFCGFYGLWMQAHLFYE